VCSPLGQAQEATTGVVILQEDEQDELVRVDGALSNLIQLKMSLLIAEGLDEMAFKGSFQPKPFCDSMIL